MISCTRRIEWDAMHRIPRHESVCKAYHGHRYSADITCEAPLDELGRVVDFGVIRDRVGGWIQARWDHTAILMEGDPDPSAAVVAEANAATASPCTGCPRRRRRRTSPRSSGASRESCLPTPASR